MKPMRAAFRFDAAPALGTGHAYRCLALAEALARLGWQCEAITNDEAVRTVPALRASKALTLREEQQITTEGAEWLIADHYGLDAGWETPQRRWAKSILVIDDLADRPHDCDLLVDQTLGRVAAEYDRLVPESCRRLTGSDFALLRPEFAGARSQSLARRTARDGIGRVLVAMGGTDPGNHTTEALRGIAASGVEVGVDVVLGSAAQHLEAVRAACKSLPLDIRLHVDTKEMPQLMAAADLAVGAAGTSTWERCCLGLPSLLVVIAENQRRIAAAVSEAGAARLLPGPRAELTAGVAASLRALAGDSKALHALSQRAAALCDGRGCDRLGLALTPAGRDKSGRRVELRLAGPADEERVLAWQRHPTTRRFSRNPAAPTADEHHRWFSARLSDPHCFLTIITVDGVPAGVLRLDPLTAADGAEASPGYEVSILVAPDHRGAGIGLQALRFLRRWQGAATIVATVLPGNTASAALFQSAGYMVGADGTLRDIPANAVPATL